MLKRIVVTGEGDWAAVSRDAAKKGFEITPVKAGQTVPSGTAAALGAPSSAKQLFDIAGTIATRQQELLHFLAESIDSREELQPGSSLRVMDHASRFGKALGLSEIDQNTLERGALLRDIGKLKLPNSILLKYSLLTHDEWVTIRQHTHFGGDVVKASSELNDIESIVRYHHECWDGTGYPDGLEGNAIPRLAHIVRLIDVFCAMTARRHYRSNVHSMRDALEHIESESGKHFAPELVRVFIDAKIGKEDVPPAQ